MLHLDFVNPNPLPSTLSFRIRFSGEESAYHFRLIVSGSVSRHSCETCASRSDRNGFVSGHAFRPPATDAPCRPAPIGRNCHRTLIRCASHQGPPAHDEGAFKSYSKFRGLKFRRHAHARVSQLPRNKLSSALPRNDPAGSPIGGAAAQLIGCSCALSFACLRRARPHRLPFG